MSALTLFRRDGSCSMIPHMLLRELGIPFRDMPMHEGKDGKYEPIDSSVTREDYLQINASGLVPAIQLQDGTSISEMPGVLTYISSLAPERHMLGKPGVESAKIYEWIAYLQGTLLEYGFAAKWRPERSLPGDATQEVRDVVSMEGHRKIIEAFTRIEEQLDNSGYAIAGRLTVVDLMFLPYWGWAKSIELDLSQYSKLKKVVDGALKLDSVREALRIEGRAHRFGLE